MSYFGGKGNCRSRVIGAMPSHRVYIETHLGGGAVMRAKRPSERQIGIDADQRVVDAWRSASPPCEVVHSDAVAFLRGFAFSGEELVYADPPYPLETRASGNRYRHDYGDLDHAELLDTLLGLPCNVLVSGQPTRLYQERLAGWRRIDFRSGARSGARTETLWANYPDSLPLHEPARAGADFRERERSKRRVATVRRKIERLTAAERSVLVQWLFRSYPGHVPGSGEEVA